MFVSSMKWRKDMKVNQLTKNDLPSDLFSSGLFHSTQTLDNKKRPILFFTILDFSSLPFTQKELQKFIIYQLEEAVRGLSSRQSGFCVILNVANFVNNRADLYACQSLLHIIQNNYPGRIELGLILNSDLPFRTFWNTLQGSFEAELYSKVHFVNRDELSNYVPVDQLSSLLEGSRTNDEESEGLEDNDLVFYDTLASSAPLMVISLALHFIHYLSSSKIKCLVWTPKKIAFFFSLGWWV